MLGYDRDGMENGEHLFLLLDGWHVDLTEEDEEELKQQLLQGANNSIVSHRSYLCVCVCHFGGCMPTLIFLED
jgi:hypothetical protein